MAKTCGVTCAKAFLVTYNCIFLLSGGMILAAGLWLHLDKDVVSYLSIVHTTPTGTMLNKVAYVTIGVGTGVLFVAFLGCCGACCESLCMLCMYSCLLIFVVLSEIILGVLIAVFRSKIDLYLESSLLHQVRYEYNRSHNTTHDITLAWDLMQVQLNCCGSRGPEDYQFSNWVNATKLKFQPSSSSQPSLSYVNVPATCCVMSNTDPKYPMVLRDLQCQTDAEVYKHKIKQGDSVIFVKTKGCYSALRELLEGSRTTTIIIIVVCIIGFLQLLGLILACCLMASIRREQSKYPWYIDADDE